MKFWPAISFIPPILLTIFFAGLVSGIIKLPRSPAGCDLSSIESKIVDFHDAANARIIEQSSTIIQLQDKLNFAEGKMREAEDRVQELERQMAEK